MRRAISFVVALALFLGGAYVLWILVTQADSFRGWMVLMSAMTLSVGGFWLWEDYIAPARSKGRSDAPRA